MAADLSYLEQTSRNLLAVITPITPPELAAARKLADELGWLAPDLSHVPAKAWHGPDELELAARNLLAALTPEGKVEKLAAKKLTDALGGEL